ncbi:nicotinate-nucleotide adenylyltransferase [Lactobacillus sp. PV034]|uniref:nicotinate-nucleotide adenylyltransferase n=1 Tax=Lactobacillus sp. PV034 TaxID=2594495 RepID=UPI00223EC304|nr:nicotinate-nucleotide adenylyltransferase [Lactobacillus sp. PV034]QNQ80135.1 nicotinate-nucleotide adenylyltransferase [Lactobacillus sp. PV034]
MNCVVEEKTQIRFAPIATSAMKIGIMGGTFNPVHQAHLAMAEQVRKNLHLDEIWFIPDNVPPHKEVANQVSARDRVAMLELATHANQYFHVKLFEILRGGVSYTVDTLRYLKKRAPKNQYYLIMGTDQVNSFASWREPDEIARLATLVGVKRPNYQPDSAYPIVWVDAPQLAISSTLIRNTVAAGGSIRYLVPEAVRLYIDSRGLYRE